ncbi:MAG: leucine-rich repeat domain-containing protein, partial [Clostridia bacterium]|nr:leucine-rich repeat domain-containing protein [Clostridia bacterium]
MKKLLPVGLVLLLCMLIFTACGGEKNTTTDVPATTEDSVTMEAPGLYDANNNLIASWDELVNTYGMRVDVDYDSFPEKIGTTSPYYLFTEISALQNGVKLVLGNVKSIGKFSLACCCSITNVTISNSVTSISEDAFIRCTSLTSITIPDSVTSIGASAFADCESLMSVSIGKGVTSIDVATFADCKSLTSITIPDSVTSIGASAFADCESLM